MKSIIAVTLALTATASAYVTGINPEDPPEHSEEYQYGTNKCGTEPSEDSKCQNVWLNSAEDFCLFSAPYSATVGDIERVAVSYCTKPTHGTRLIPKGTLSNVHFVKTPHYVQITGNGDFTKLKIKKGDEGGELDPHGYDGLGNPIGGLVFGDVTGKAEQFDNWTEFISDDQFCIRACHNGDESLRYCEHIYDVMGCFWNMPGNYGSGFDECDGEDVPEPMGVYKVGTSLSTWYQGVSPTPSAGKAGKTSSCTKMTSPTGASYPTTTKSTTKSTTTTTTTTKDKRDAMPTAAPASELNGRGIGYSKQGRRHVKKALA